jgi:hypothetical protein
MLGGEEETVFMAVKSTALPGTLPTLWQNDEKFKESYMSV